MHSHYLTHCKLAVLLFFSLSLSACSTGRIEQSRLLPGETSDEIRMVRNLPRTTVRCHAAIAPLADNSVNRRNTLFVHPGLLLFGLHWDRSLAVEAGTILTEYRFAGKMLELPDRDLTPIYQHAITGPGTEFIGIHYSMGGRPDILRGSLDAIKQAAQFRGVPLHYHALLFDPFSISDIGTLIDVNESELGYVFVLLSSEYSFLRPDIRSLPRSFIESEKVFFIYAEDFGESWGHFGMLNAFRGQHFKDSEHSGGEKMRTLFQGMLALALNGQHAPALQDKQACESSPDYAEIRDMTSSSQSGTRGKP